MRSTPITALGTLLFRLRSFTPVPVLLLVAWQLWRTRDGAGPGGPQVDAALNVLGLVVAFAGQALRFHTLGLVREGTSGQGSVLEATGLNRQGPYAHVRNPLYVGNLGITLGLLLIAHEPWTYAVGLLFFFGQYFFIIRAEERFLLETHGAAYQELFEKVPRWLPRLTPAFPGRLGRFDLTRALKKEHNPFTSWALGAIALVYWELHARGGVSPTLSLTLMSLAAAVIVTFATIKAWKRGLIGRREVLTDAAPGR